MHKCPTCNQNTEAKLRAEPSWFSQLLEFADANTVIVVCALAVFGGMCGGVVEVADTVVTAVLGLLP